MPITGLLFVTDTICSRTRHSGGGEADLTTMAGRLGFIVDWLDPHAGIIFKYQLMFFTADSSIEMYDIKNRRIFLKKVVYPSVKEKDLYIGSTITVYSRQLKVVDFADEYTKNTITQTQQMAFVAVKPSALPNLGKIVNAMLKSDFVIAKMKMASIPAAAAQHMYGKAMPELTSAPVVGIAIVADNAIEKFKDLYGDGSMPNSIVSHFGDVCVASSSVESVAQEVETFFSLPTASKLSDTTLCLIKPSAMEYSGLILDDILGQFDIAGVSTFFLERPNAVEFYEVYKGVVPEFNSMVQELTSGPFVAVEVAGVGGGALPK